jgi:hypothetical protein
MPAGSPMLRAGFVVLTVVLALGLVGGVRWAGLRVGVAPAAVRRSTRLTAAGATLWILATGLLATAGVLRFAPFPPTMLGLIALTFVIVLVLGRSELGGRLAIGLPLAVLVGAQAFRVVVELLLHRAYVEGLMPVQMSYSGYNFDVVTGISAALLALVMRWTTVPVVVVRIWNVVGLLLLANVLVIALLSAPTPLRQFHNEPANVWITKAPWVWLPTVMVLMALLGHVLIFRRLSAGNVTTTLPNGTAFAPPTTRVPSVPTVEE